MTTQQYREVKRKALVGERIKIVAASYTMGRYDNGDEFTVNHVDRDDDVYLSIDGKDRLICLSEFVVLEPITQPSAPSPLSSDPLYAAFRQFVADNADELRKLLPEIDPPGISVGGSVGAPFTVADSGAVIARKPKPPTRAQVIAKATADVAELLRIGRDIYSDIPKESPFHNRCYAVNFHVNRDKRTVTALVNHGVSLERVPDAKFTAKCSPADVFHAEIGKAIALRKALGLAVPSEYTDAPQPEPATGAKVRKLTGGNVGATLTLDERDPALDGEEYGGHAFTTLEGGWIGDKQYVIIDDTDVDYSAVESKEAA